MNDSRTDKSEFSKSKLNKVALEIKKSSGTHSPKLNIYKLILEPEGHPTTTYRDLFRQKFSSYEDKDSKLFDLYFEHIKDYIGNKNFRKDDINKKVIGKTNDSSVIQLVKQENSYVDGVIEGGKYGIKRKVVGITSNNAENIVVNKDHAVLDWYYLLIYTPLNSRIGFLLIQSYTEESVTNSIKDFIASFFSNDSYKIKIEPYLPQTFIKKYIESSTITEFGITTTTNLSSSLRNKKHSKKQIFELEIRIKPQSKMASEELLDKNSEVTKLFKNIIKKFVKSKNKAIKKEAFLTDNNGREALACYDKNKQNRINIAESTIYLEDDEIICDQDTGMPDFKEIQNYCISVLQEIKEETEKEFKEITPDDL